MFSSNATQVSAGTQAEAVDYDSTNDYLSRSTYYNGYVNALTFLKETFTFSCWFYNGESTGNAYVFSSGASAGNANLFYVNISTTTFQIAAYDGSGTFILNATTTNRLPLNTFCNVLISIDMTSTSNRYVYVNDQLMTMTWSNYVNSTIQFGTLIQRVNSLSNSVDPTACRISNVFLDFTYRDLSITANRRLFVTADLKPAAGQAALNPIVYLAMSDPTTVGTNTGTGGNFTLNGTIARSGRGPNQYNAPYSDLDGSADYLSRTTAPTGIADSQTFTLSFTFNADSVSSPVQFKSGASSRFEVNVLNPKINFQAANASGTTILDFTSTASIVSGRNYVLTIAIDLTNTAKRHVYLNGESLAGTWGAYNTSGFIDFDISTTPTYYVGRGAAYFNGRLGALWFNTSYIDLSVASNLAKFVTGTGINAAPVDLGANGELPTGTSPLIYLPMYGNNAGKNYGTGGDFTVNSGPYTGARGPNEFWSGSMSKTVAASLTDSTASRGSSDLLTMVMSYKAAGAPSGAPFFTLGSGDRFSVGLDDQGRLRVGGASPTYNNFVVIDNAAASGWCTMMLSIDLSNTSKRYFSNNGPSKSTTTPNWAYYSGSIASSTTCTIAPASITVDLQSISYTDGQVFNVGFIYFITGTYIDFNVEANRLLFVDAFGYPVNLTQQIENGLIPQPMVYYLGNSSNLSENLGTFGNFTPSGTPLVGPNVNT